MLRRHKRGIELVLKRSSEQSSRANRPSIDSDDNFMKMISRSLKSFNLEIFSGNEKNIVIVRVEI